jgi:formylglycine-generating enzyme required for sulfatase activity
MKKPFLIPELLMSLALFFLLSMNSNANNLQVSNVTLTGQDLAGDYTLVQFDISWENSWHINDALNHFWDAAWVFVKYRVGNSDQWEHATLDVSTAPVAPAGCSVDLTSDGTGGFIYRTDPGTGDNNWTGIQLRWLYGADGLEDDVVVDIKVFAIEMVYVPEGSFWVGDGNAANRFHDGSDINEPALISSEDALTLGGSAPGNISTFLVNGTSEIKRTDTEKPLHAAYPKGFQAFYCMKYEASEGQYVDFLNCLTRSQQQLKTASDISQDAVNNTYVLSGSTVSSSGNTVQCPPNGNGITSPIQFFSAAPERACGYIGSNELLAYMDWAALRPMTSFEYEKACRGSGIPPIAGGYAWGDNVLYLSNMTLVNEGAFNEHFTYTYSSYYGYDFTSTNSGDTYSGIPNRPYRSGIFAASAPIKNRIQTGATYYGIMEMTGNLNELVYNVDFSEGRLFDGSHGDGQLDIDGNADANTWSDYVFNFCMMGGDWVNDTRSVSYRWWYQHYMKGQNGARGVRTAE